MRRTGILSDAGTARHCALGRPVPLGRQDLLVQSSGNNPLYYRPTPKDPRMRPRPSRAMYMTEASSSMTGENESVKYTERIRKEPANDRIRYMEDVSPFLPATDMYGRPRPAMTGTGPSWLDIQADPMRYAQQLIRPLEGSAADIADSSGRMEGRLKTMDTRISQLQSQLRQQGTEMREALVQIGQPPLASETEKEEAHTIANYLAEAVEQMRDTGMQPTEKDIASLGRTIERNMPELKRTAVMKAAVGETMDWMEEFDRMTEAEGKLAQEFAEEMYGQMLGDVLGTEVPKAVDQAITEQKKPRDLMDLRVVGGLQAGAMRGDETRRKAEKIIRKMKANPSYIPNPTEQNILKDAWIQGEKLDQPLAGVPMNIIARAKQELEDMKRFEEQEKAKQKGSGKKKAKLKVVEEYTVQAPKEEEGEEEWGEFQSSPITPGRAEAGPKIAQVIRPGQKIGDLQEHAKQMEGGSSGAGGPQGSTMTMEGFEPKFSIE